MAESQIHCNLRSTSMPSKAHPTTQTVQESFHRLRDPSSLLSLSSSSAHVTSANLHDGLCHLADLYVSVKELMELPLTRQVVGRICEEKWVEEVLDGSLLLLDLCGMIRDVMTQMKEHVQDLQSVLRRRRGADLDMVIRIKAYMHLKKKRKKEIKRCLKTLKRTETNSLSSPSLLKKDQHLSMVIAVVREAATVAVSIFEALYAFISASSGRKIFKRSPSWKWINGTSHVVCEGAGNTGNIFLQLDAPLTAFCSQKSHKNVELERIQDIGNKFEAVGCSILALEDGLECMFERLIQTRVSLLNALTSS